MNKPGWPIAWTTGELLLVLARITVPAVEHQAQVEVVGRAAQDKSVAADLRELKYIRGD